MTISRRRTNVLYEEERVQVKSPGHVFSGIKCSSNSIGKCIRGMLENVHPSAQQADHREFNTAEVELAWRILFCAQQNTLSSVSMRNV